MTWGGSLNKKGSEYLKLLRNADKTIEFLTEFKQNLKKEETEILEKTIEIISREITKISENRNTPS